MKGQFIPYGDDNPRQRYPYVALGLIVINLIVFIWSLFGFENIVQAYGFIPARFSFLTMFTSMFLHGGIFHLGFNMLFLWIFGDNVEDRFGHVTFLAFYLLSGLIGGIVHFLSGPFSVIPAIGASGAISGIMGAYLSMFPRARVRALMFYTILRVPAYLLLTFWFAVQLVMGLAFYSPGSGGVAFFAHIGGFVFGYLAGRAYNTGLWKRMEYSYQRAPASSLLVEGEY
jgi:membrane associated rhomboid family serine protease